MHEPHTALKGSSNKLRVAARQLKGDLGRQTSPKSLGSSFACLDHRVCVRIMARIDQLLCPAANQLFGGSASHELCECVPLSWGAGRAAKKINSFVNSSYSQQLLLTIEWGARIPITNSHAGKNARENVNIAQTKGQMWRCTSAYAGLELRAEV